MGEIQVHPVTGKMVQVSTADISIKLFEIHLQTAAGAETLEAVRRELRGKNLACWCRDGNRCHGDVLLQIANSAGRVRKAA